MTTRTSLLQKSNKNQVGKCNEFPRPEPVYTPVVGDVADQLVTLKTQYFYLLTDAKAKTRQAEKVKKQIEKLENLGRAA